MTAAEFPLTGSATVHVLVAGYAREEADGEHVGSTVTLTQDGNVAVVVDPGMVASRSLLLAELASHGVQPESVTDVVFSHHHPDHTVNAALFPAAKIHDHWAIYDGDRWISREADGAQLSPSVRLLATPGHTPEDISTLAATADGRRCWRPAGPASWPWRRSSCPGTARHSSRTTAPPARSRQGRQAAASCSRRSWTTGHEGWR
jgi:hypothetical protein